MPNLPPNNFQFLALNLMISVLICDINRKFCSVTMQTLVRSSWDYEKPYWIQCIGTHSNEFGFHNLCILCCLHAPIYK
jgi:hypothetical protein